MSRSCKNNFRKSKKTTFELSENNEEISNYNDINANLYLQLLQSRKIVLDIIQDRNIDLNVRAVITLKFIDEVQEKIDENEITAIKDVREKFSNEDFINEFIKELDKYKNNKNKKYINIKEFFEVFKNLKHIITK